MHKWIGSKGAVQYVHKCAAEKLEFFLVPYDIPVGNLFAFNTLCSLSLAGLKPEPFVREWIRTHECAMQ